VAADGEFGATAATSLLPMPSLSPALVLLLAPSLGAASAGDGSFAGGSTNGNGGSCPADDGLVNAGSRSPSSAMIAKRLAMQWGANG